MNPGDFTLINIVSYIINYIILGLGFFYIKGKVKNSLDKELELFRTELNSKIARQDAITGHYHSLMLSGSTLIQERKFEALIQYWNYIVKRLEISVPIASFLAHHNITELRKRSSDQNVIIYIRQSLKMMLGVASMPENSQDPIVEYKSKEHFKDHKNTLDDLQILLSEELWDIYMAYLYLDTYVYLEIMGIENNALPERLILSAEEEAIKHLGKVFPLVVKQTLRNGEAIMFLNVIRKFIVGHIKDELAFRNSFNNDSIDHMISVNDKVEARMSMKDYMKKDNLAENVPAEIFSKLEN